MRLIDADSLDAKKVWSDEEHRWIIPLSYLISEPTAFDIDEYIDKVVQEFEFLQDNCFQNGIFEVYENAIEIVKRGGKNES